MRLSEDSGTKRNLSSYEQFIRRSHLAMASTRRCPLILDGLCLHVLSSFQRTGTLIGAAPSDTKIVQRGTYQIYDSGSTLSTTFSLRR